jgi:hypothetical protein
MADDRALGEIFHIRLFRSRSRAPASLLTRDGQAERKRH